MAPAWRVLGIAIYLAFCFRVEVRRRPSSPTCTTWSSSGPCVLPVGARSLVGVLAVLGYSVNESVGSSTGFARPSGAFRKLSTHEVIDHAITQTMKATIITHAPPRQVLSMFFLGPSPYYFALALTIGILFGIYLSVFVAAAIAMWLGWREDLVKTLTRKDGRSWLTRTRGGGLTMGVSRRLSNAPKLSGSDNRRGQRQ